MGGHWAVLARAAAVHVLGSVSSVGAAAASGQ